MNEPATGDRDAAVREALIGYVATHAPRSRRTLWAAALVAAGVLVGAGASTAAFAVTGGLSPHVMAPAQPSGQPQPDLAVAVAAPPGTHPVQPIISALGSPIAETVNAAMQIPLDDRPYAATHVRVTVTPVTAGGLSWGTGSGGNNPSSSWSADDIASGRATAWYDFPLSEDTDALFLAPQPGSSATVSMQYLVYVPTHLSVNPRGETYGVEGGPDGVPDLIAVVAETPDGDTAEGYARAADLYAFSPDHPGLPSNPGQALTWQAERDAKYPGGWTIPVFESDGVTQIGEFRMSG